MSNEYYTNTYQMLPHRFRCLDRHDRSGGRLTNCHYNGIATFGWFYFGWLMPLDPAPQGMLQRID
jgi:hypothetical protein